MKTITDIFNKIKFGDILLVQESVNEKYKQPKLICVVAVDVWDMACTIFYVDYKSFEQYFMNNKKLDKLEPEIIAFPEWGNSMNVLGHWKGMPDFKELLKTYRKQKVS